MKACRVCGRLYPGDARFCPVDGQGLYSATQVPAAGDDDDPRVAQVLHERYQVRRVVADGGMGRVYEALDLRDQRQVALKILHAEVAKDEVAVARFKREFEVSAQLSSVHIVDVLDFQPTVDGSHMLVMEYLHGEELRSTLKRQQLSMERVVRLLSQVALGLDEAHDKKLVHRDLKPENLFLCQTREGDILKVLDFGSVRDNAHDAKKLTVMGTTIGSPFYMPPEQAQGLESLDRRADVWALGAIAYECLTGQVPFKGVNGPSILLEILTKEPAAPSQASSPVSPEIPPAVDSAILRALRKTVGLRTATVGELADEVGRGYGLEGDHESWAQTTESELRERIAARLPAQMEEETAPKAVSISDEFFGDGEGLGASRPPSTPAGGEGAEGRDAPTSSVLTGAMIRRSSWIAPVVAVVALIAGIVLALLFV